MIDNAYWGNIKIIFFLGIILLILIIVKTVLLEIINRKNIESASKTIIGNEEIQEDYKNIISEEYGTLAVLADGIGKNEAGRISSITAVKTISRMFKNEGINERVVYFLKKAFNAGNKEILKRAERDKGGASVLSAVITDGLLYYALVGEAMLCIFRNNELVRITEGHTIGEVAKSKYSEGKIERDKALKVLNENRILYYMGQESFKNIEISDPPIKLEKNDIVVLMSRGIYENIRWIDLEEILCQPHKSIDMICDEITEEA
ncbi:MAG: PP2C family protein-serine/threonine phosphatase, partial [Clostridium sp.]